MGAIGAGGRCLGRARMTCSSSESEVASVSSSESETEVLGERRDSGVER